MSLLVACALDGSSRTASEEVGGRYTVTINVKDGRVIEGMLDIVVHPDSTISGTKSLTLTHGSSTDFVRPLLEPGEVRGRLDGGRVFIELNPLYADHNFGADGRFDGNRLTGLVTHVGFIGATEDVGTFVARKR